MPSLKKGNSVYNLMFHFIYFHFEISLEAANSHSTHLNHRLAQMRAEASRLHQLLYHNQQCLEGLRQEKDASICRLEAAQMAAEEEHRKHVTVCINMNIKHLLCSAEHKANFLGCMKTNMLCFTDCTLNFQLHYRTS
jgi:hypothetical protein